MNSNQILNEFEEYLLKTEGDEGLRLFKEYPRLYATIREFDNENITINDLDRWYNGMFSSMKKDNFQDMLKTLIIIIKTVDELEDGDEFREKYIHLSNFNVREIMNDLHFYVQHLKLPPRIVYNIMHYGWNGKYRELL